MRTLVRILVVARELWPYYVGIIACAVAMAATGLVSPFIIKAATDYVVSLTQGKAAGIAPAIWLAAGLLVAELANTLFTNLGGYLGDVMAIRLRSILSRNYFEKLLSLPQTYFDGELTGTIINRLSRSITETTGFLNAFANNFFAMVITVFAVVGVTAYYSWPLAIMIVIVYPLFMWLTTLTSSRWQRYEAAKNRELDIAGGRFAEVIGQIRVVKSFVQQRRELTEFSEHYHTTQAITRTQSSYWHRMDSARRAVLNVIFFGVFAIIFAQTARGVFTIGVMVLLLQLVNMARQPVFSMSFLVDFSQRAIAGSKDYFEVMATRPEQLTLVGGHGGDGERADQDEHGGSAPAGDDGPGLSGLAGAAASAGQGAPGGEATSAADQWRIEFDRVQFAYAGGERVLREVSFDVPAGSRVALVSESGAGKTTLMSLLMRLYDPDAGQIRVGGRDIATLPVDWVRSRIGVVFQDPSLFSGTIWENIAYARPDASRDEVEAAARSAGAHEFISAFPEGYDSQIGERGLKLSGGQKQRIAVARAIVKDAPMLILDEATSSLDSKSERLVQAGLENLMAGRTTVIIAHRLSTIASVDCIVTLRDGQVDEIGSPGDLATSGGIYAELLALQAASGKQAKKRLRQFEIRA